MVQYKNRQSSLVKSSRRLKFYINLVLLQDMVLQFKGCMCCGTDSSSSLDISDVDIIDYSSDDSNDSMPALQSRTPSPRPSLQSERFWISEETIQHHVNMMWFIESEKQLFLNTKFYQLCGLYEAVNFEM